MRSSCLTHPTGRTDKNKCEETISCHSLRLCKASHVYWSKGHVAMNQDGCQNVALCLDPRCHRCWKVQLLCILFLEVQTRMFPLIPCLKGVEDKEMASLARVQRKLLGENLLAVVCDLNYKGCYLHVWSRMAVTWCRSCTELFGDRYVFVSTF